MDTVRGISARTLRILTYTILIKAVISTVMLSCTTVVGLELLSVIKEVPGVDSIYIITQALGFINIVACVMCLGGISALSEKFTVSHILMVVVLIIECIMTLLVALEMRLMVLGNSDAASVVEFVMLASVAVARLLMGVALFFFMKGIGEILRRYGDITAASLSEHLGFVYICCNTVAVILAGFTWIGSGIAVLILSAVINFAAAILELLMYRKTSDATFRLWRQRTFGIYEKIGQ